MRPVVAAEGVNAMALTPETGDFRHARKEPSPGLRRGMTGRRPVSDVGPVRSVTCERSHCGFAMGSLSGLAASHNSEGWFT